MRIHYLNTDLDLQSREDLRPLTRALEQLGLYTLHLGRDKDKLWRATLEAECKARTPNGHITAILKAIDNLPTAPRAIMDRCRLRECNIGYECGVKPWAFNQALPCRTLQRMAQVGLSLRITLYPPDQTKRRITSR